MTDPLSIRGAAAEVPDAIALIDCDGALRYSELASAIERRAADLDRAPAALVADLSRDVAIEILARLEVGAPTLLVDPRLPARTGSERARWAADLAPDAAVGLFSSGTTGAPRLVQLSRSALIASGTATWHALGRREGDRWLACLPLAHIGGLSILSRAVIARCAVVLAPRADLEVLVAQRVTLASLVPTQLARLVDGWAPHPELRAVLIGGAHLEPSLLAAARARGIPAIETYGMTETCSHVALDGRPVAGAELRIAPDRRIQVRGPMLMLGADVDRDGCFTTADRGAIDATGRLHGVSRALPAILSGGETIDPVEVEQELERIPGVMAVCVVGLSDEVWGERVAAAVVADPDALPAIERAARERLGFRRPRAWWIVPHLPQTTTGKVDRAAVAREFGR